MVDLKGRCVNVAVLGTLRWPRYSIWELTLNNARLTDRCTSTDDDVSECHLHCRSKLGSSEYHYIILFDFKDMWVNSPTFRSRSRILLTSRGVFPLYLRICYFIFYLSHSAHAPSFLYSSLPFFLSCFPPASFPFAFFVHSICSLPSVSLFLSVSKKPLFGIPPSRTF